MDEDEFRDTKLRKIRVYGMCGFELAICLLGVRRFLDV